MNKEKQSGDYFKAYLKAVRQPLPEMEKTFNDEFNFLSKHLRDKKRVLDVGCGIGRPADKLAQYCGELTCVDNEDEMLEEARRVLDGVGNVEIIKADVLSLPFGDEEFDFVYATYNLLGSILNKQRQLAINEMVRVAKNGSVIASLTWKQGKVTTDFLRKYYSSIGINVLDSSNSKTVTSKGTFDRLSKGELIKYYDKANLDKIDFIDIGAVWMAIVGTK